MPSYVLISYCSKNTNFPNNKWATLFSLCTGIHSSLSFEYLLSFLEIQSSVENAFMHEYQIKLYTI